MPADDHHKQGIMTLGALTTWEISIDCDSLAGHYQYAQVWLVEIAYFGTFHGVSDAQ